MPFPQKLGIEYYDRDIVDEVAKQLNLPVSQISDAEESSHNHFFSQHVSPWYRQGIHTGYDL